MPTPDEVAEQDLQEQLDSLDPEAGAGEPRRSDEASEADVWEQSAAIPDADDDRDRSGV